MFGLAVEKLKALFKLNKGFYTHLGNFVKKPNGLKHSFKIETNKMLLLLKALFFFLAYTGRLHSPNTAF